MAVDALEPGDGTYPHWPRTTDGTLDRERMPTGRHVHIDSAGERHLVDLTPRHPDGTPITPPAA
jgi:hypothetical protein